MILWEFLHNGLALLSPQIRIYLWFCGNFYIIAQCYSHHRSGFIYDFVGIVHNSSASPSKHIRFYLFLYVLWEALHYRSASLSIHISFYLFFVGSFTLQISIMLNTHQFLLMFCGKLYITDQHHAEHTSVFTYVLWEFLHYKSASLSTQISVY